MSDRVPVPVGVRLRAVSAHGVREVARAAATLDESATGFVVLGLAVGGLDPSTLASYLARRTTGIGVVVEAAAQRDHPYNIARRTASLDHLTRGRAGWWVLPHDPRTELGLGLRSSWVDASAEDRTLDAVTAVRALWRTWPASSVVGDVASNVFTRAHEIRHADHVGIFSTAGPLTVPTTPQGEPVIFGPGSSDLATDHPEGVVTAAPEDVDDAVQAGAAAVVVDTDDVDRWVNSQLPPLIDRGVVRPRPPSATLRGYLGIGVPTEPDLSSRRPAFT